MTASTFKLRPHRSHSRSRAGRTRTSLASRLVDAAGGNALPVATGTVAQAER